MATNPLQNPRVFNKIILGNLESPGLCELKSGGDREMEIQISNFPGTTTKIANTKGENLIPLTYEFQLWTNAHFQAWEPFVAMLNRARLAKPRPEVLSIVDPRLESNNVKAVTVTGISALKKLSSTKFAYEVKLLEFKIGKDILGGLDPNSSDFAKKLQAAISQTQSEIDKTNKLIAERQAARKKAQP